KKDFQIGQTTLALGRTLDDIDRPPSVSEGIISALSRVWGKAVQTDAKVSPTNYGGPLVDLQGRVIGVMVPASPFDQEATAGIEIDGKAVANQAQVMHYLGPKYEGDTASVKVRRGKDVIDLGKLTLGGQQTAVAQAFLGILPLRDDPEPGVEVRYVYPKSPAD